MKQLQLVTAKPFIYIANLHEDEQKNIFVEELEKSMRKRVESSVRLECTQRQKESL